MTNADADNLNSERFTILVVDDVEDNRDLLVRRFALRGFNVLSACDGAEALDIIDRSRVDVVILDVMMPNVDGLEVLRTLRSRGSRLPVIMATARAQSADVVQALNLGANDYVTKPIDFPILHARVVAVLRQFMANRPRGHVGEGSVIADRYELEELIGEGGFGSVYRARHRDLERAVAVKILRPQHLGDAALARFRREGVAACRVVHPNALAVLDSGVTTDGVAYLVMELLDGRPLREELEWGLPSFQRIADVIAPVCEALAAAHDAGVVHRDVKPANIILHQSPTGEVPKVCDFGIAKLVFDNTLEQRITVEGWIIGTPIYMAPERFRFQSYDGKSDVYSVGVMLHEMVAGGIPFSTTLTTSREPMALAAMHTDDPPTPLRQSVPETPAALEALVLRALSKNPDDRPTARELAAQLRGAVVDAPERTTVLAVDRANQATRDFAATLPASSGDSD